MTVKRSGTQTVTDGHGQKDRDCAIKTETGNRDGVTGTDG